MNWRRSMGSRGSARRARGGKEGARRSDAPDQPAGKLHVFGQVPAGPSRKLSPSCLGESRSMPIRRRSRPLPISPRAELYSRTLDLANRSVAGKQLTNPTPPGAFIVWAKRYEIGVPVVLENEVAKYGHFIGDWETLYSETKAQLDETIARLSQIPPAPKEADPPRDNVPTEALYRHGDQWLLFRSQRGTKQRHCKRNSW